MTETPLKPKRVYITAISYCDAAGTIFSPITPLTPKKSTSILSKLTEMTLQGMMQSVIVSAMKELNKKHDQDISTLNKKFDMFQRTADKGVIEALTEEYSTLVTKTYIYAKIDNLHQTMDSIKQ